jgi:hypothetical protein
VTVTLAVAGLPLPPWVEDTIVVVLFFTPVDVAVSVTRNVQLAPAGIAALAKLTANACGPTPGAPPQLFDTDGVGATLNPDGSGSANVTPVNGVVVFGFVNVNVNVVFAPTRTGDGLKAFASDGGNATMTDSFAVLPVPPSVEVTAPLVLFFVPAVVPFTFTCTVQLPEAGIDPPVNATEPLPAVAATVPPHVFDNPFGVPTTNPLGRLSLNATPDSPVAEFGFVIVNRSVVVPLIGNTDLPNTLAIDGGDTTNTDAVALVPMPPSVELTAPDTLILFPGPVARTVNAKVHSSSGSSVALAT